MIANSNKLLQLLCWNWIPAFAGVTANEDTGMILPRPVIPAKAGIQTKQSTISNNVYQTPYRSGWISEVPVFHISLVSSPYYVWLAESFNPDVLWDFRQKIMVICSTYTVLIHYYMYYLPKKSRIQELRAKRWKIKAKN